jgi:hypothetical protein
MKREEEKKTPTWKKVALIVIGVAFIGMMVLSSWGMGWLTTFRSVQPLDTLSVQFTFRDDRGQAILTTDRTVYQTGIQQGSPTFLTSALQIQAGKTGAPAVQGVAAYNPYLGQTKFALFGLEYDQMSVGLLGMHAGETKKVAFQFPDPLIANVTAREFDVIGGNFSTSEVGDWIPMGLTTQPRIPELTDPNETAPETFLRIARIVEKTSETAILRYDYPSAEISFSEFPR